MAFRKNGADGVHTYLRKLDTLFKRLNTGSDPSPKKKMNPIKVESTKRSVAVMADWREGLGFLFNELVYAHKPV